MGSEGKEDLEDEARNESATTTSSFSSSPSFYQNSCPHYISFTLHSSQLNEFLFVILALQQNIFITKETIAHTLLILLRREYFLVSFFLLNLSSQNFGPRRKRRGKDHSFKGGADCWGHFLLALGSIWPRTRKRVCDRKQIIVALREIYLSPLFRFVDNCESTMEKCNL